jgi:uncharacterized membrane protein
MNIAIIIAIIIAAGLVLISLVRGLIHFANTSNDLANGTSTAAGASHGHMMQNKMMFARVKWQAITIVLLVVLGMVAAN